MLPIYLLTASKGQPILVELKSGETVNGTLVEIDTWMNLTLKEVIETSSDGETFLKIPEIFLRGKDIKYLRLPDEVIAEVKARNVQDQEQRQKNRSNNNNNGNDNERRFNNRNFNSQGRTSHNNQGGRFHQNQGQRGGNRRYNNNNGNQDAQRQQHHHQQYQQQPQQPQHQHQQ